MPTTTAIPQDNRFKVKGSDNATCLIFESRITVQLNVTSKKQVIYGKAVCRTELEPSLFRHNKNEDRIIIIVIIIIIIRF